MKLIIHKLRTNNLYSSNLYIYLKLQRNLCSFFVPHFYIHYPHFFFLFLVVPFLLDFPRVSFFNIAKRRRRGEPGFRDRCTWAGKSRSRGGGGKGYESHAPWRRLGAPKRIACWFRPGRRCSLVVAAVVVAAVGGGGSRDHTADEEPFWRLLWEGWWLCGATGGGG